MSAPGKVRLKVDLDATVERLVRLWLGHEAAGPIHVDDLRRACPGPPAWLISAPLVG